MTARSILIISCSLATASGWITTNAIHHGSSDATTAVSNRITRAFVPGQKGDDLLRGIHQEDDASPVIHTDTDEVEKSLEEAYADYEEMLKTEKDETPFVEGVMGMRTPRNNHLTLTAFDSSKKLLRKNERTYGRHLIDLDPGFKELLFETIYWDAWYRNLGLEEWRHE